MSKQVDMYYAAEKRAASLNQAFLELINHPTNPLTRNDLQRLIFLRPHTYSRFVGWLERLPPDTKTPKD